MPRRALIGLLVALAGARLAAATDPHLDPALMPGGCRSCHAGHGASASPMLPIPQREVCLSCHDTRERADAEVRRGILAPGARPPLLGAVLQKTAVHPLTPAAFSRHEAEAVTCTSCHSPHRRSTPLAARPAEGLPRVSTRDPERLEYELCENCHGSSGPATRSPLDLSRLFDATSRSFHPVHAPTEERSPSVRPALAGRQISCTDCHANDDRKGIRGPHGSAWPGLLAANYVGVDGAEERGTTHELCWSCHDRDRVLSDDSPFPLHRLHVVAERASCATCHSAHGSVENRALIRFGEETRFGGVSPSATRHRLAFDSASRGSGTCTLTCHGSDHADRPYGFGGLRLRGLSPGSSTPGAPPRTPGLRSGDVLSPHDRQRTPTPPPD
ncbi:MAG: hypothetical protein F9K16_08915 [Thermoanaerobaculia bacterium]|nr:MAG: hypothetical protein F9K16_08915 [Thermoanaerobaculia bacterium]